MLLQQSILSAAAGDRWAKEFHFECRKGDGTVIEVLHKLAPLSERARPVFAAMKWPARDSDTSGDGARFNKCGSCGMRSHRKKDCPHGNDRCTKCGRKGHWARMCPRHYLTDEDSGLKAFAGVGEGKAVLNVRGARTRTDYLKAVQKFVD
ncbi:zinc knuckle protein [Gregarina niphandrodes]|uniref:Zinc knuckle protein n=1 Tax=Gregarina niphandrodes TaxID=110365 RepID=A0A023AX22_GRENI|nr:zinc knuckle protein [Gregarina niphandrodes]EZG43137.1 zinc knuckle protein [Gregarina niphandrodes]|eukprot:XP_011133606.1 zinc knuckle protein [Gregarina niphandrodes]